MLTSGAANFSDSLKFRSDVADVAVGLVNPMSPYLTVRASKFLVSFEQGGPPACPVNEMNTW